MHKKLVSDVMHEGIIKGKISRLIVTAPNGKPGREKPIGVLSITDIVRDMSFA